VAGEWWDIDLDELHRRMIDGVFDDNPSGAAINGMFGELYNCSGNHP
jgi:laccase